MKNVLDAIKCWDVMTDNNGTCNDYVAETKEEALQYACAMHENDRKSICSIREIWCVTDGNDIAMVSAMDDDLCNVYNSIDYNGECVSELELEYIRRHGNAIHADVLEALDESDVDVDLDARAVFHFDGRFFEANFGAYLSEYEEEEKGYKIEDLSNLALHNFKEGEKYCGYCTLDEIAQAFSAGIWCAYDIH